MIGWVGDWVGGWVGGGRAGGRRNFFPTLVPGGVIFFRFRAAAVFN